MGTSSMNSTLDVEFAGEFERDGLGEEIGE